MHPFLPRARRPPARAPPFAGHFKPLVVFDQQTVSSCMAALLIHDLCNGAAPSQPKTPLPHPHDLFHLEVTAAVRSGSSRA
eukprot:5314512-Prymnesium_polylepis.1